MQVSIRELRASTKQILNAVDRGDTVFIAKRGKIYAKIIPIKQEKRSEEPRAFGMWKDNAKVASVRNYIRNLRKGRHAA